MSADSFFRKSSKKVLLAMDPDVLCLKAILDLADEWKWQIVTAHWNEWRIKRDLNLSGVLTNQFPDSRVVAFLRRRNCPGVRFGRFTHPADDLLPAVLPDIEAQGRLAAEFFAERCFNRIACLGVRDQDTMEHYKPLFEAFYERAGELGAQAFCHGFMQEGEEGLDRFQKWKLRHAKLRKWLRDLPKPVGLFAMTDGLAVELLIACESEGIQIPEEIAVLGCGDTVSCRTSLIPISSVRVDQLRQAREAMHLLKSMMEGNRDVRARVMIPPSGVAERASTDVLAVSHPLAARAVSYIWDHICEVLSVDSVADAMGVKRRSLERLFKQHVGCGIKNEIRRRRMQVYCRELRSSDDSITALSAKMGYSSQQTMYREFVKATGTTPSQYRRIDSKGEKRV